jgi:GrpB-like predicted nucleotidyltransferase (UPF0157 family)
VRHDPIVVVESDSDWPASFAQACDTLAPVLASWTVRPIEHIGSTAVPGLPAKPIIDMLAVVADIDDARSALTALAAAGWIHAPEPFDDADRKLSVCTPSVERRTHHLHVVEQRSERWRGWLAFRDYLRANGDVAREYAALKVELAAAHGDDPDQRDAYRSGKHAFVRHHTAIALRGAVPGRD